MAVGSASQNGDIVTRGMLVPVQSSILTKEASSKDQTREMRTPGEFGVMDEWINRHVMTKRKVL